MSLLDWYYCSVLVLEGHKTQKVHVFGSVQRRFTVKTWSPRISIKLPTGESEQGDRIHTTNNIWREFLPSVLRRCGTLWKATIIGPKEASHIILMLPTEHDVLSTVSQTLATATNDAKQPACFHALILHKAISKAKTFLFS